MEDAHIEKILWAYKERITDLGKDKRFRYVLVFKNYGKTAGASLAHPHSQLIATPITPRYVKLELSNSRAYYLEKERCIFCDIIRQELGTGQRIVYENEFVYNPVYTDLNRFYYYEITDKVLQLSAGTYYFGWQQIGPEKIYVGFDENINTGNHNAPFPDPDNKIWYNVTGFWNQSLFDGSLMIRPCFGGPSYFPITVNEIETPEFAFKVYPNPASDRLYVRLNRNEIGNAHIFIYDLYGRIMDSFRNFDDNYIDVSGYANGMYLIRIEDMTTGISDQQPVIIVK